MCICVCVCFLVWKPQSRLETRLAWPHSTCITAEKTVLWWCHIHRDQGLGPQCVFGKINSLYNICPFYGDQCALGCLFKTLSGSPKLKTLVSPNQPGAVTSDHATPIVSQTIFLPQALPVPWAPSLRQSPQHCQHCICWLLLFLILFVRQGVGKTNKQTKNWINWAEFGPKLMILNFSHTTQHWSGGGAE